MFFEKIKRIYVDMSNLNNVRNIIAGNLRVSYFKIILIELNGF